jgi:hypothetical protein
MMFHTPKENAEAKKLTKGDKTAAISFDEETIEGGKIGEIKELLVSKGYVLVDVSLGKQASLGVQRAVMSNSTVFVGSDGMAAAMAFTTEVPAVVCYSYRDPCYFAPFRRGVPFSAVLPLMGDCDTLRICLAQNSFSEYGKNLQPYMSEERAVRMQED